MVKCTKGQVRWLKTALRWKIPAEQRQRIQMVLLRESGMTQPLIAAANSSRRSSTSHAIPQWSNPSRLSPISPSHTDVELV
jgi:hypothetical protein